MRFETLLRRYPVCSFFALAFGISWGGILIVMAATDFNLLDLRPLDTGLIFVLMLLGPSVAGLALTALLEGRAGFHRLRVRAARWRVGFCWYLVALMTMPLLLLATLWPLSIFLDPAFSPRFQWPLFAIGLVAGSFEEVGWTGFAAPRLLHPIHVSEVGVKRSSFSWRGSPLIAPGFCFLRPILDWVQLFPIVRPTA
ncbi:MAG: hypothetical protein CO105_15385 [Comamonadaceae bacterium CG_4_9_14_3_um_filter_60_33]|nr:MAG: hypothetical protein AUK51_06540 [Comamonadaceae bacterium CG2_30_59_20]PIY28532.1 MAG: hypothetical protein COZ09_09485 [Comamonadaceae bacterium CG_4_10_14_3_um_filter_60_42]PJB40763.1 MAG: hypothetical protein CO105_15385 [Comamonadaceae bacterium CG_4_9_14_3_um_filter_60_33]